MTIKDRGNIKWTCLMLPEHVKELRRYIHEEYYNLPEPAIDEQQMDIMNEIIYEAMEFHQPLRFMLYKNNRLIEIGYVHFIDQYKHEIRIKDFKDAIHIIAFSKIKYIHKN
jgi:YolD-like protein